MSMKTVFLSSTAKDLAEYRQAAYEAVEGLDDWHCIRMEELGARDAMPDEFCEEKVAECDVFVGIIGDCYGSISESSEKSYTEQEYDAAIATDRPRLIFLAPEDFPLPANLIEPDEKRAKQSAFRERVSSERIRDTFTSPESLAWKVVRAIRNWEHEQATVEERPSARPEGVLPLPPQPYFAHPYALQQNFTGRARERGMLTEWLVRDERPILALVALGGMGKSALTWVWLQRDVLGLPLPSIAEEARAQLAVSVPEASRPGGVLWWSFYERESSFQQFLDQVLTYASGGTVDPKDVPSIRERMQVLYNLLCQRRFLLVLDGMERILRAYAHLDAAYHGEEFERDERGDFRSCTDPHAGTFLQWLASGAMKSKALLTSRHFPRELDDLAGCHYVKLDALDPEDTVAFFHAQGVEGTRAEIQAACAPYGYLPLALRLLSGLIVRDKRTPGDIQVARRYSVLPELKGKEQHHILQVAYNALDKKKRKLLSRISAFRSPMVYEALSVFNTYTSGAEFDAALDELIDRGLLLFDRERRRYDLHPIVRKYAYDRLADKEGTHIRLHEYFAALPAPEQDKVQSLDDLSSVIELYYHSVYAGQYDEAAHLFHDQLKQLLYYRFGTYQTCIELLRALFPEGENRPPRLKDEGWQGWTINELAVAYAVSGEPRRALQLFNVSIELARKRGIKKGVAAALGNLATQQIALGELAGAEDSLHGSIKQSREIGHKFWEAVSRGYLGELWAYEGAFDRAGEELSIAQTLFSKLSKTQSECVVWGQRARQALLMRDAGGALKAAGKAKEIEDKVSRAFHPYERDSIQNEWLAGAALVFLADNRVSSRGKLLCQAETHLTKALSRCRQINLVELEPDILLEMARLRWAKSGVEAHRDAPLQEEALGLAKEALGIADRCEYRLKQADIHNFLAQVALDGGNLAEAQKHAEIAKERAWCDGPPHCYKPALDEAERLLNETTEDESKEG